MTVQINRMGVIDRQSQGGIWAIPTRIYCFVILSAWNPAVSFQQREVVFDDVGRISVRPGELLSSPSPYNLIVRTRLSIISSGTETALLYNPPRSLAGPRLPVSPGAGLTGEIVQVGDAVMAVRPELRLGQRVFVRRHHQAYVQCNALNDQIYVIPDDLSDEAMLLARQAIIGVFAVKSAGIGLGTSVHVIGLGVIGQLLARLAIIAGARPVSATDHHESRQQVAASQSVVQIRPPDEHLGDEVDVALAVCGSASAITQGLAMVAVGGSLLLVGGVMGMVNLDMAERVFRRNVRIIGAHEVGAIGPRADPAHWVDLLDLPVRLIRDGSLNVEGLITHHIAPNKLAPAYQMLYSAKNECLGAVIDWSL